MPQGLGFGIVAGSTLVKLPQVLAVVGARSADGLNPFSFELETLGLVIAATYGFMMRLPFSAFGEVVVSARRRPAAAAPPRRPPRRAGGARLAPASPRTPRPAAARSASLPPPRRRCSCKTWCSWP